VGYVVAGWVTADQFRAGRSVVADAVNSVEEARDGWATMAGGRQGRWVRTATLVEAEASWTTSA
jgi:hypothetical protein